MHREPSGPTAVIRGNTGGYWKGWLPLAGISEGQSPGVCNGLAWGWKGGREEEGDFRLVMDKSVSHPEEKQVWEGRS